MKNITPHLWFDNQAEEAVTFYTSTFKNSKIGATVKYGKAGFEFHGQPEGTTMTVTFEIEGQQFMALNGGPVFTFNPSISFLIYCETQEEVEELWAKLSEGGMALMELGTYPFSQKYGWTMDKYGVSWQIMYTTTSFTQKIIPTLMFVRKQSGNAEEAMNLYTSVFKNSSIDHIMRYEKNEEPDKEGTIKHAGFTLNGQQFAAMDSAHDHKFNFNEAISFLVYCESQEEIDYYWEKLSEGGDPAAQQCGWLKDKYGVSWQIAHEDMDKMMTNSNPEKFEKAMNAVMKMKKINLAELEAAANS